jgi:cysteine-rich repeat protein
VPTSIFYLIFYYKKFLKMSQLNRHCIFFSKKLLFLALLLFLLPLLPLYAAKNAIGIRVARNSEHLSPSSWYDKYAPNWYGNSSGGPSSISLAGYEAVSVGSCSSGQGETIYVNAANTDEIGNELYTNIYIISCPVGADQDTIDIFEQLIDNWSFNVNIDDDLKEEKVQRDTKRLSDITTLKQFIENYRANISNNNRYPALASGTYEVGKSISYWSSWQDTLGSELQATLPTPTMGPGWGPLISLDNWSNSNDNTTSWPTETKYPKAVGIDYTSNGCRQITTVKDQDVISWCEGGCVECSSLIVATTAVWPTGQNPSAVAVRYQDPASSSCRELLVIQDGKYSILEDNYSTTAAGCSGAFNPATAQDLINYIAEWPDALKDPTAVSWGIDYNNCEHIFVVQGNNWAEYTSGADCPYAGWTPIASLDIIPEALGIEWPDDIKEPDAISMAWDENGWRHIYAFKGNNYREYIDYNRPYVYQTTNQGLSYSICTYFETSYLSLDDLNCGNLQIANYAPAIDQLTDRQVSVGKFFNYDIFATDLDDDTLTWDIDLGCGVQTLGAMDISCPWGASILYVANTAQENIKKIYGFAPDTVPSPATINVQITVSDGRGGTDTKSFKLIVAGTGLTITSTPVTDITIGDDYQYDVEAVDAGGYYPLAYSWVGVPIYPPSMSAGSINADNGLIFATPDDIGSGSYDVTVTVTNTQGDTASQTFTINIKDFDVKDIPDTTMTHDQLLDFFAKTTPEGVNKIQWSINVNSCTNGGVSCTLTNLNATIEPNTGEITATVSNMAILGDVFNLTVTAVSDLNPAISHSKDFDITISDGFCINGVFEAGEQCDDGNTIEGDGCSSACIIEPGWFCSGSPSVCTMECGNGVIVTDEQCDDGNPTDGDGCSSSCAIEAGWECVGTPSVCTPLCGNSVLDPGEICDDGNTDNTDACLDTCVAASCGDGFTWSGVEDCDSVDASCCSPTACTFMCPPFVATNLDFSGGPTVDLSSGGSDDLIFPACRTFDPLSGTLDTQLLDVNTSVAIVYVTETSAGIGGDLSDIKDDLKDTMDNLHNEALTGKNISIGLVEFDTGASGHPIVDISTATNRDSLKSEINTYSAGGTVNTEGGVNKARKMLNSFSADLKIIVLLSQNQYNSGDNPTSKANSAKANGMLIYTIAYKATGLMKMNMCDWSSGTTCNSPSYSNSYAYPTDAPPLPYSAITSDMLSKMADSIDIIINGITYTEPVWSGVNNISFDLSAISCMAVTQNVPVSVNFSGGGQVRLSNTVIDYCYICP